jgi:hypothetical protein
VPSRRLRSISAISCIGCNRADAADRLRGRATRALWIATPSGKTSGGLRIVRPAHRGGLCIGQARGFSRSRPWQVVHWGHTVPERKSRVPYDDVVVGIIPERNLNNGQPSLPAWLIANALRRGGHVTHAGCRGQLLPGNIASTRWSPWQDNGDRSRLRRGRAARLKFRGNARYPSRAGVTAGASRAPTRLARRSSRKRRVSCHDWTGVRAISSDATLASARAVSDPAGYQCRADRDLRHAATETKGHNFDAGFSPWPIPTPKSQRLSIMSPHVFGSAPSRITNKDVAELSGEDCALTTHTRRPEPGATCVVVRRADESKCWNFVRGAAEILQD